MNGLLVACAALILVGAITVVGSTRSPVSSVVGAVVAAAGLAGAFALLGAPVVGLLQLALVIGFSLLLLLFGTSLVGTGSAVLAPPTRPSRIFKVVAGGLALALLVAIARGQPGGSERVSIPLGPTIEAGSLGRALLRDDLVVVAVTGLLLLVAIVGAVALAGRGAR